MSETPQSSSDKPHPSLNDLALSFAKLADRVDSGSSARLEPFVTSSLKRAIELLELTIPGLEAPPDSDAAHFLARSAAAALERGAPRETLARALRGLSFSPHHPGLFYLAGSACFELGSVDNALRMLRHALWIQPGHPHARRDLEAISAYLERRERTRKIAPTAAPEPPAPPPADAKDSSPTFDQIEDAPPGPDTRKRRRRKRNVDRDDGERAA